MENKLEQYLDTMSAQVRKSKQASKQQASNAEILDKVVNKIKKQQETDRVGTDKRKDERY